jgi:excisionase family DNA binding protein
MNDDAIRLFPIPRAAEYLSTTTWAIRRLVWGKKLPHIRLGKRILIDKVDLDAFVQAMKKEAA